MSFVSIRCPNCAAAESILVGENQYRCRYCDNTFNYLDPNAPKITKNITIQEVQTHHCPLCGRGVTAGTSNLCMKCGASELCSNCVFDRPWLNDLVCRRCLGESSDDCLVCRKPSLYKCSSCTKLHEKDPSHVVTRHCMDHLSDFFKPSHDWIALYDCRTCGPNICRDCAVGTIRKKCKNCGNKLDCAQTMMSMLLKELNKRGA